VQPAAISPPGRGAMTRLRDVFALDWKGLNVPRALEALAVLSVPSVVLVALDEEKYLLSVIFGVLCVTFSDPGGELEEASLMTTDRIADLTAPALRRCRDHRRRDRWR
jgi:hypothetical protein